MRAKLALPLFAAGLIALAGCDIEDFGGARYSRDFHYAFPLNASATVSVETFNGSIDITPWEQNTIDISGTKYGPTQTAADDLEVRIDHAADHADIRVVRPSERRNNQGARLAIKVPRTAVLQRITSTNGGVRLEAGVGPTRIRTSNGSVRVDDLRGALDAQTTNSSIQVTGVDGDVNVHTSNGSIHAKGFSGSLDAVTSNSGVTAEVTAPGAGVRIESNNGPVDLNLPAHYTGDVRVHTSNDPINVRMPAGAGAHLIAQTSNASINSDFEMMMSGELKRNHVDAQFGGGGALLDLSTSNGSIRVLKR